jgi:hypothetical protein
MLVGKVLKPLWTATHSSLASGLRSKLRRRIKLVRWYEKRFRSIKSLSQIGSMDDISREELVSVLFAISEMCNSAIIREERLRGLSEKANGPEHLVLHEVQRED